MAAVQITELFDFSAALSNAAERRYKLSDGKHLVVNCIQAVRRNSCAPHNRDSPIYRTLWTHQLLLSPVVLYTPDT